MDAQGALDSFLGRLTTVLVNEAQLLGGVRSDVEFIKDEMESMNGLILHLTEAQHRDHQVRAWMRQVVGLTRDCEGNVELYVHYVGSRPDDDGLLGYLRRIIRFLRTISVRHRIATRIQELKVRARDVGDRRQRYGVTVPASTTADMNAVDVENSRGEEHLRRRAVLLDRADEPPADDQEVIRRGVDTLIKCLSTEPETAEDGVPQPQVWVFKILGRGLKDKVAEGVQGLVRQGFLYSSVASIFGCKAWLDKDSFIGLEGALSSILEQVSGFQKHVVTSEKRLINEIRYYLDDERFLIVFDNQYWEGILDALLHAADGCLPGSAIIMITDDYKLALSSSPYKIIDARSLIQFYEDKLSELNASSTWNIFCEEFTKFSAFARKMFLHLLYVKPNITEAEKDIYRNAISNGMSLQKSVDHTMVMLCYNELPSKYRSCLLHLTIFSQGHVIKTTRLARRWIAEGLITTTSDQTESAEETGEYYSDVLFIRGFILPVEISAAGNIKSFTLKDEVHKVLTKIAREVNIVDTNLPTDLARHLSIHNRIVLPKSHSIPDSEGIAASLRSLAASPQWQLLKVLDLEGCNGLEKQHLKSICKILLLKYLSLRNTDVTELPKQIKELQCLETLDVRETKVRVLAKKAVVLPLLKHFLAGHKHFLAGHKVSADSFSAVQMPVCIEKMNNMELLSHVRVSNSKELTGISQLLKLRKLGVALYDNHANLCDLLWHIEKLHRCLRSLSIRIHQQAVAETHYALTPPNFITSLNITGPTSCVPHMIQELHQLVKLTLTETYLKEDGLRILGKLRALRFLRLQNKAYTESELSFKQEEFQKLSFLLVGTTDVTSISFANGAAPKLERIIWSFPTTACVSGLDNLYELREFELNGDCNPDQVRDEIKRITPPPSILEYKDGRIRKFPVFKHNPDVQQQDETDAASAASSSSDA